MGTRVTESLLELLIRIIEDKFPYGMIWREWNESQLACFRERDTNAESHGDLPQLTRADEITFVHREL